jgi:hypothetical protein
MTVLTGDNARRVLIFLPALVVLGIMPIGAATGCLTPEQSSAIANITSFFNMSDSSLMSIFDMLCQNITDLNSTAISAIESVSNNLSCYYNSTQVDSEIVNATSILQDNMTSMYSSINVNAVSVANQTAQDALSGVETRFSERINAVKSTMVTNDTLTSEFNSLKSLMYQNNADIAARYNSFSHVWMWICFLVAGISFGGAYLWRYHPEKISFVTGVKAKRISNVDMISPSDFTTQLKRLRELKLALASREDITYEEKQVLFNKIQKSEISTPEELEQEIGILKAQRPPEAKRAAPKKGTKRR